VCRDVLVVFIAQEELSIIRYPTIQEINAVLICKNYYCGEIYIT
jgi:hypothetical protein